MIARIEALNYRCLRDVSQDVRPFQVLVGPNGSGKTTFLDVIGLISDFLREGLDDAILIGPTPARGVGRARRVEELFFLGQGTSFELAVELQVPPSIGPPSRNGSFDRARYELAVGIAEESTDLVILAETFWLVPSQTKRSDAEATLFPLAAGPRDSLLTSRAPAGWRKIVNKVSKSGSDYFQAEFGKWNNQFKIGPRRASLANVPEDREKFPITLWARNFLREGVQKIALNVAAMRQPCSPSVSTRFAPDGSNLPRVVQALEKGNPSRFRHWNEHLQTVLPLHSVEVRELPADNHLYLCLKHPEGDPIPSWLLSDGTLRMLVLTLLPYLDEQDRVYLIEEPENGIHPTAIESVLDSLRSVYENQVLLATHSPLVLGQADRQDLLCFHRCETGEIAVVSGEAHPQLKEWQGEIELSTLYAAGVLS